MQESRTGALLCGGCDTVAELERFVVSVDPHHDRKVLQSGEVRNVRECTAPAVCAQRLQPLCRPPHLGSSKQLRGGAALVVVHVASNQEHVCRLLRGQGRPVQRVVRPRVHVQVGTDCY